MLRLLEHYFYFVQSTSTRCARCIGTVPVLGLYIVIASNSWEVSARRRSIRTSYCLRFLSTKGYSLRTDRNSYLVGQVIICVVQKTDPGSMAGMVVGSYCTCVVSSDLREHDHARSREYLTLSFLCAFVVPLGTALNSSCYCSYCTCASTKYIVYVTSTTRVDINNRTAKRQTLSFYNNDAITSCT